MEIDNQITDVLTMLNQANRRCLTLEDAAESIGKLNIACRGLVTIVIQQQGQIKRLDKKQPKPSTDAEL